ncbi:MAG: ABC transporter ATP-binding protein [Bacillota bacterium]|nr:ABC transporter ATP-binding protein [Bacillota bacterium]
MGAILKYIKGYTKRIINGVSIKLAGTIAELLIPYILEYMIDGIVPKASKSGTYLPILAWGAVMIVLAITVRYCNITANRMAASVARDSIRAVRHDLFDKTNSLSGARFDAFTLPSLISRMTSDTYNVQSFIGMIQRIGIRAPIMLFGGVLLTAMMDPVLSIILICMIPFLGIFIFTITRKGVPLYKKVQEKVDRMVCIMREDITGIRVVKALSKTEHEIKRFHSINNELTVQDIKAGATMVAPGPIMNLCLNIGLTLVVIVGAYRVNSGTMQRGVILAFLTYFNMILMAVMGLNKVFMAYSKASASAERIEKVMADPEDMPVYKDDKSGVGVPFITFENVSFSYPEEDENSGGFTREKCLDNINFTLNKGESLGIMGSTGCGKTTIINLLMRFYDADEGRVYVDGKDVRCYDRETLRKKFGVVFQSDTVFADTLYENINFGRSIEPGRVKEAAKDAMVADFIENLDEQYKYKAAIKGANLSGGQKQRVLIARALAAKPDILVFDDSSSALDYKTDANLRKAINENYEGTTLITVAQRISSVMNMDKIIVLEDGRMIGYGSHEELKNSCDVYREIYDSQMGAMPALRGRI